MDSTTINRVMNEIYIPPSKSNRVPSLPGHHPSLVLPDRTADSTHRKECGCSGGSCIKEHFSWTGKSSKAL
ncbi:hypothetical protein CANCADRAFT_29589 [Tortispora caseinolytica NRRL Y-17796]|uniref:Uncharacterized protein n=1 Tax=Tortispora caseinolytica NRRL Y-17796 TaxID=767744 RepID=A0A1E4T9Q4_9ASCO|nr:hypothetical protein CANCADRAFT_29589 [Tortispora caseinolytica NRRL Y-17796]